MESIMSCAYPRSGIKLGPAALFAYLAIDGILRDRH